MHPPLGRRVQWSMLNSALALVCMTLVQPPAPVEPTTPPAVETPSPTAPEPALAPAPTPAGALPRVDPKTGRDLTNYPPHLLFDYQHLRVSMLIPDVDTPTFQGEMSLSCVPIGTSRRHITLNAGKPIEIRSVSVDGQPAEYTRVADRLEIDLPVEAQPAPAAPITLTIAYTASRPSADGCGLVWSASRGGSTPRAAQIYSQGEPDCNRLWIPCHDFPNDRMTTEMFVTVQDGYAVMSNGRLLGQTPADGGRTTWHWLQSQPHSAYLMMVAIGKFDQLELNPEGGTPCGPASNPKLSMPVWGPPGTLEAMRKAYARTPAMVRFFEERFDEPYPWDKYAQIIVRNFAWGGMENTSATVMSESSIRGGGDQDDLISHELAHQWMGDLLTCRSWEHLWLNEGWASFSEALWAEHQGGEEAYRRTLRASVRRLRRSFQREPAHNPESVPMVSARYTVPDDTFSKRDDVYAKGGFILHMLRTRLGDDVFWRGVHLYIDRFKFKQVETDDFRRTLEEVSGESLERFFRQWCYRAGMPDLKVTSAWDEANRQLTVTVDQRQPVDADNPAYAFRLPVDILLDGDKREEFEIAVQERSVTATFSLPSRPASLLIDPEMAVLATYTFEGLPGKAW